MPSDRFLDPMDPLFDVKFESMLNGPVPPSYQDYMNAAMARIAENVGVDPMLMNEIEAKVLSFPLDDLLIARDSFLLSLRRKEKDKMVRPETEKMPFYSLMAPSSDGKVMLDVPLPSCRLPCCEAWSDAKLMVHFETLEHCCTEKGARLEVAKWLERFCQKKLNHWRYSSIRAASAMEAVLMPMQLDRILPKAAPSPPRRRL